MIWAPAAGFVHARRLSSTQGLWDFAPLSSDKWRWLMVGQDAEVGWKVTFADGWNEPLTVVDGVRSAETALIEAVDFLGWDNAVRERELADEPAIEALDATVADAELNAPEVAADPRTFEPGSGFTKSERAMIEIAVQDNAARYHGGPLGFGREDAARYVSEGSLGDLVDQHGLSDVWRAVADHIDAQPELLELDEAGGRAVQIARRERAQGVSRDALAAYKAGDLDRAWELVDSDELIDPDHGDKGYTWQQARRAIEERRAQARDGGSLTQATHEAAPATPDLQDTRAADPEHAQGLRTEGSGESREQRTNAAADMDSGLDLF